MEEKPLLSISVVSHGQGALVRTLLSDIAHFYAERIEILLTLNIQEVPSFDVQSFPYPIKLIQNAAPKGFGANHNYAHSKASGDYFCVLNPDIRIKENVFPVLMHCLEDRSLGVVAPKIVNSDGGVENSARRFPTPLAILRKAVRKGREEGQDYGFEAQMAYPDWIGGMFMVFRSEVFGQMKGFNERFFLYYEDVELCARLWLKDYKVGLCTRTTAIHEARRQSHRDLKYLKWHLTSMIRFFLSPAFFRILWSKR